MFAFSHSIAIPVLARSRTMPGVRSHPVEDRHGVGAHGCHSLRVALVKAVNILAYGCGRIGRVRQRRRCCAHKLSDGLGRGHCNWSSISVNALLSWSAFLISSALTNGYSPYSMKLGH